MPAESEAVHFFTGEGALCGARFAHRWTIVDSSTSCPACRELLEARDQFEAETNARMGLFREIRGS